jgi:uncharacterized membrane protein YsdA (DUF1294 family)
MLLNVAYPDGFDTFKIDEINTEAPTKRIPEREILPTSELVGGSLGAVCEGRSPPPHPPAMEELFKVQL